MTRRARAALSLLAAALLPIACGSRTPEAQADLLLVNGRVYTLAWSEPATDGTPAQDAPYSPASGWHPDAEAVAVRGDRIVFVGSAREASAYQGPQTQVVDLRGATVVPGLIDSHVHIAELGASLERVNLVGATSAGAAIDRVAERATTVPKGNWIVGWGWDEGAWANHYPDMTELSARVPDHPVVLRGLHSYAVWGNRLAFERAGITRATPAPSGGEIRKDARGDPTGILINNAGALLTRAIPAPTPAQLEAQVRKALAAMAEAGYVAVHEAGAGSELVAAFEALNARQDLPTRVYVMLSARDEPLLRRWLARGPDRQDARLVVRAVKAFYDGALGSRGARLLADYADKPGHRGVSGGEFGFHQALVAEMMNAGFQVCVHAIGDAGNRETLDFIERAEQANPAVRGGRHRIEHAQVLHPDDVGRFAALDVIASMEPAHAVEDMAWAEDRLGPERVKGAYAWRTLRKSGARLAFNSDLPGTDYNIFYGLHAAITRRDKSLQPPGGWYPEQRMTPEEALRGYTTWGTYAGFQEGDTGLIAPGRWADLTVMDVDPLALGATAPEKLLSGHIRLTIVAGRVVYSAR
jgi:predicted amidohydrolase YtcJ